MLKPVGLRRSVRPKNPQSLLNWGTLKTHKEMSLKIFLDIKSYDCLSEHLSSELMLGSNLNEAPLLGTTRVVDCDNEKARDLLFCARSHCPGAVTRIAEAIRAAGFIL